MCYREKLILLILSCVGMIGYSQEKTTLSGVITDQNSNETLIGVNVIIPELSIGTTTNDYGFYSLTLPKGTHQVSVSYLGYQSISQKLTLTQPSKQNFKLSLSTEILQEVVVQKNIEKLNVKSPQMSVNNLSIATIKKIPAVLGETDIIKSLLLLPGVSNAGEASSGFNVRGGATDQNLILLDEATIFNSDHLFGFFSVFNPDAVKNVKLYKG